MTQGALNNPIRESSRATQFFSHQKERGSAESERHVCTSHCIEDTEERPRSVHMSTTPDMTGEGNEVLKKFETMNLGEDAEDAPEEKNRDSSELSVKLKHLLDEGAKVW